MIASLKGSIIARREKSVVLETGGAGYEVFVSLPELLSVKVGDARQYWTYQYVREDTLSLYGFRTEEELSFFQSLIAISDVGPRSALALLSVAPLAKITAAIEAGNLALLPKVSGIGRKTAERIVLELKGKTGSERIHSHSPEGQEVMDALMALGYRREEAEAAARDIPEEAATSEERVRAALRTLDRQRKKARRIHKGAQNA